MEERVKAHSCRLPCRAIATAPQGASVPLHLEAHEADGSEEQTDEATDEAHSSLCLCIPADCGHSCSATTLHPRITDALLSLSINALLRLFSKCLLVSLFSLFDAL